MVEIGIKGKQEALVSEDLTAKHIGSGTVLVLSTPMMIALMEKTSRLSVKPYLEDGQETAPRRKGHSGDCLQAPGGLLLQRRARAASHVGAKGCPFSFKNEYIKLNL